MDYATNPVQATSGTPPAASDIRSASPSGSGVLSFNGFLQNASAGTAADKAPDKFSGAEAVAEDVDAGTALTSPASTVTNGVVTSPLALNVSEVTGRMAHSALSPQTSADPLAAHAMGQMALPADLENDNAANGNGLPAVVSTNFLHHSVAGETGIQYGKHETRQLDVSMALGDRKIVVGKDPSTLAVRNVEVDAKVSLPNANTVLNGMRGTPATTITSAASQTAAGAIPAQGTESDLAPSNLTNPSLVSRKGLQDTAGLSSALNTNDSLLKTEGAMAGPRLQGGNAGTENMTVVQLRGASLSTPGNSPVDPRAVMIPTTTDLTSPQSSGVTVSASIATAGVAQDLLSRQRSGAANDDSVSQIAKGGNEARLLELNGARNTSTVTQGNTTALASIETKTELDAKHTNAITLAATRDGKALRAAMPVVNQQQMAARIGGVDVTQIGSADFAMTQIDTTPAAQTVSRIAILEPGWTSQLGSDLRALVARGPSSTQVQVTPAELGPLDIEVSINRQEVSVRILAMHGQTREMLEAALPRLREVLGQNYTSVDVSVGNGSGNSSSHSQSQNGGAHAGMMAMSSDSQDGLRDSAATRQAEAELSADPDSGDSANDQEADGSDPLMGEPSATSSTRPDRGLVDAYA